FDVLAATLAAIAEAPAPVLPAITIAFELQAASLLGYRPRLDACASCGAALSRERLFSPARGGLLCDRCGTEGGVIRLSADALAGLSLLMTRPVAEAGDYFEVRRAGCTLQQPYPSEVGAGTFNPATFLRSLGPEPWRVGYLEPSRRPKDGRYGENPNRFQQFYQYQVLLKPSPADVVDQYFDSLKALGIEPRDHDLRLVEDDWESPTLGAAGLGWQVWMDGTEISQFTYFQQCGGIELEVVSAELTYGLDRIGMQLQERKRVQDLVWAPGRDGL